MLGTSATNPITGNQDVAFSYFNNLNTDNILSYLNNENGQDPSIELFFDSIPEDGASGSATLNLANGRDSVVDRELTLIISQCQCTRHQHPLPSTGHQMVKR